MSEASALPFDSAVVGRAATHRDAATAHLACLREIAARAGFSSRVAMLDAAMQSIDAIVASVLSDLGGGR